MDELIVELDLRFKCGFKDARFSGWVGRLNPLAFCPAGKVKKSLCCLVGKGTDDFAVETRLDLNCSREIELLLF